MTSDPNNFLSAIHGSAGAQPSFLEECGVIALLSLPVAHRSAEAEGTEVTGCAPVRTQTGWERATVDVQSTCALRSCAPAQGSAEIKQHPSVDWVGDAARLVACLQDDAARCLFTDYFEETAAFIEYEQNQPRHFAERQAFALMLEYMHRCGIDMRTGS